MSNLKPFTLAEPLSGYVKDQIKKRQSLKGSGFGDNERTAQEIAYLTSQNAWIRCASAVDVTDTGRIKKIFSQHKNFSDNDLNKLVGNGLAKKYVLFNGTNEDGDYNTQRGGYSIDADPLTNALYGIGGLEFGQVPMPGITAFSVDHVNMGAIRQGTISIKAHNRVQFNLIETLYIQLGFHIFLEWGNNIYFDNNGEYISNSESVTSLIEDGTWFDSKLKNFEKSKDGKVISPSIQFAEKIEEKRIKYAGNYDAFFGYVRNFNWQFLPDGTYDIVVDLVSAGDVIEGIKVGGLSGNNLIREKTQEEGTSEDDLTYQTEGNKDDIRNYLYCLRNTTPEESPFNKKSELTGKYDYVDVSDSEFYKHDTKLSDLQYIRLGAFMKFLEDYVVPYIDGNPICLIDEGQDSLFTLSELLISSDPSKCLINNKNVVEDKGGKVYTSSQSKTKGTRLFKYFESVNKGDKSFGIISNIYLKISHVEDLMKTLIGTKKIANVNLYDILSSICESINSCLGGNVSLHPSIQNDDEIIIRDFLLEPKINTQGEKVQINQEEKEGIIKAYGFNTSDNSSNLVRGFSFKSEISNDLSNQISIGASANDQTTKDVNPFFKQLRKGLDDRYRPGKATDGKPEERNDIKEEEFWESCKVKKKSKSSATAPQATGTGVLGFRSIFSEQDIEKADQDSEPSKKQQVNKTDESKNNAQKAASNYQSYVQSVFNSKFSTYFPYFNLLSGDAERGAASMKLHLDASTQATQNKVESEGKKGGKNLIAFIPITLTIELDGISGFKIYNRLSIDTEFLPVQYPDNIDFVILGIGHSLENNDWVTRIRALSMPDYSSTDTKETEEDLFKPAPVEGPEEESEGRPVSDVVLFAPTGDLPFDIRNDSQGSGNYGSPRGGRIHKGIDIKTEVPSPTNSNSIDLFATYPTLAGRAKVAGISQALTGTVNPTIDIPSSPSLVSGKGTTVFAPISGFMVFTTPGLDSVLPGVRIEGTGKYKGYRTKIFYFAPDKNLLNKVVTAGQPIGNAIEITLQPKYAGVTNHIHFSVQRKSKDVNPKNFEYTINPGDIQTFESILTL